MEDLSNISEFELAAKNREVFNSVHTIQSIPATLFMIGLVLSVLLYFLFKSFPATLIFLFSYFPVMYFIHKDDVRGLKIWLACWGDKTVLWESGRRKEVNFVVTYEGEI